MIEGIDPRRLPSMAGNHLYLDYISGAKTALTFYSHPPLGFDGALRSRRGYPYPRQAVAQLLTEYNAGLGAHRHALDNSQALGDGATFCVVGGQQAGFLGGPAFTTYKIVTTIRLADKLREKMGIRTVPVFWLASEDHDFGEVSHTYYLRDDGEVGQVGFDWEGKGRPIADMPVTDDVKRAYDEYLAAALTGVHRLRIEEWFDPRAEESYAKWQAQIWARLFSERGLVIVEPRTLRPLAGDLFRSALEQQDEIRSRLEHVASRLTAEGYAPALASPHYGELYTFDSDGRRVRVDNTSQHLGMVGEHPEHYSTDAALRPIYADAILPVVASVLGPGETAYQAMLKPLYDLFDVPQPLLYPRKSYTVATEQEVERIEQYGASVDAILTEQLDIDAVFRELLPISELEGFVSAQRGIEEALEPLRPYLEGIDPSLGRTWEQTLSNATRGLEKLEDRAMRARMSQLGYSRGELQALRNALLPRGRLQERVFPLPHFLSTQGIRIVDELFSAGALDDFSHNVLILEDANA